jgi:hypothetical protein
MLATKVAKKRNFVDVRPVSDLSGGGIGNPLEAK